MNALENIDQWKKISSTKGYAHEADDLLQRYEAIDFFKAHKSVLHLIPDAPGEVLDIGSGTGRDAGAFAKMGHRIIAVEPTKELRVPAMALHPSTAIVWIDDSLPELARLQHYSGRFDLIWLSAVWMHLEEEQRRRAMKVVSRLVQKDGKVMISLVTGLFRRVGECLRSQMKK
ncbi:MAG: methyltransferase domain-containing protein [Marinicaulis sp.]|nr:methyltransferase domain-containing protein [Marinicaulis sp.]